MQYRPTYGHNKRNTKTTKLHQTNYPSKLDREQEKQRPHAGQNHGARRYLHLWRNCSCELCWMRCWELKVAGLVWKKHMKQNVWNHSNTPRVTNNHLEWGHCDVAMFCPNMGITMFLLRRSLECLVENGIPLLEVTRSGLWYWDVLGCLHNKKKENPGVPKLYRKISSMFGHHSDPGDAFRLGCIRKPALCTLRPQG